ncbi:unnamed protein product [Boreogadus saida]
MAHTNTSSPPGALEDSPNMLVYRKMEDVVARMQEEKNGIPIKTVKSFLSKIPSVILGSDIVQWMLTHLNMEDPVEALHLGTLMAAHGYFFPISDHVLSLKDDGTFYRFQTPYFWPSNCWEPENGDYGERLQWFVLYCRISLNYTFHFEIPYLPCIEVIGQSLCERIV